MAPATTPETVLERLTLMKTPSPLVVALLWGSVTIPLLLAVPAAFGQKSPAQKVTGQPPLNERVIGWGPIRPAKGNAASASEIAKNDAYTPGRRKMLDTFQGWIQKSYTPVGRLAEPWRIMYPASVTSSEQPPRTALMQMSLWSPKLTPNGTLTRAQPASQYAISIASNATIAFEPAAWFNTPKQFYFTMCVDRDGTLLNKDDVTKYTSIVEEVRQKITTGPDALEPGTFVVFPSGGSYMNVVLIPGGKLPMVPVSRAETLRIAEEGCKRARADGKQEAFMLDKELKLIAATREKYRDSLNEPAVLRSMQMSIYLFDSDQDPFDNERERWPLYKYSPETYAKCKADAPQWILVQFPIPYDYKNNLGREVVWKAMTEKFNFAYVYNTFFAPGKVKGQAYRVRGGG